MPLFGLQAGVGTLPRSSGLRVCIGVAGIWILSYTCSCGLSSCSSICSQWARLQQHHVDLEHFHLLVICFPNIPSPALLSSRFRLHEQTSVSQWLICSFMTPFPICWLKGEGSKDPEEGGTAGRLLKAWWKDAQPENLHWTGPYPRNQILLCQTTENLGSFC